MKEVLEKLKCIRKYSLDEEKKEVEVFIDNKDYYYKYQIERMLYLENKDFIIKITTI